MRAGWLAGVCVHSGTQAVRSAVGHAFQGHQRIHGRNVRQHRQVPTGTHSSVLSGGGSTSYCITFIVSRLDYCKAVLTSTTMDCQNCCTGSTFQTECSTISQSRSPVSVELKYLVDCCDVATYHLLHHLIMPHIRSSGLFCWNALSDDLHDPSRSVADWRRHCSSDI